MRHPVDTAKDFLKARVKLTAYGSDEDLKMLRLMAVEYVTSLAHHIITQDEALKADADMIEELRSTITRLRNDNTELTASVVRLQGALERTRT